MFVKRGLSRKTCTGLPCNACAIWLKLNRLNPNVQRWKLTLAGSASDTDAIESCGLNFRPQYTLLDGR
jgi:hypothetical protein